MKHVATKGESTAFGVSVTDSATNTAADLTGASASIRIGSIFTKVLSGAISGSTVTVELEPTDWANIPSGYHSFVVDLLEGDGSSWEIARGELHALPAIAGA